MVDETKTGEDEELLLEKLERELMESEDSIRLVDGEKHKFIYLIGEINEELTRYVLKSIFETNWTTDHITNLDIYIASEGGYLKDCFAMIDAVNFVRETFGIKVTTFGLGEVASSGFFLFLLGDTRVLFPNCRAFVHEHIAPIGEQTYGERKRDDKDQKVLYTMYVDYCANRLQISNTKVRNLLKKNRFLTNKELVTYGIITPIEDDKKKD